MSNKNTEQQLKQLRTKVSKSKDELSSLKGQQKALLSRLSKEFGIASAKGAKKHLDRLKTRVDNLEKEIDTKLGAFQDKYGDILSD